MPPRAGSRGSSNSAPTPRPNRRSIFRIGVDLSGSSVMCRRVVLLAIVAAGPGPGRGQEADYQTDFPPEEFRARWAKVYDRIGDKAVAIVQGLPQVGGFIYPR